MAASTHFDLYLDGVLQPATRDIENHPPVYNEFDLTNYPDGLPAGSHTFVGVWYFQGVSYLTLTATILFN